MNDYIATFHKKRKKEKKKKKKNKITFFGVYIIMKTYCEQRTMNGRNQDSSWI